VPDDHAPARVVTIAYIDHVGWIIGASVTSTRLKKRDECVWFGVLPLSGEVETDMEILDSARYGNDR